MPDSIVPVSSPVKGVNRVMNREGQPPDTCWDALNVLPFDSYGRRRVATRYGTSKAFATCLSATSTQPVQGMLAVHNLSYPQTLNSTGLSLYNESFASMSTFQQSWTNVPSTWTISSGSLIIPINPGGGPLSTSSVPLYRNPGNLPGNLQVTMKWGLVANSSFLQNESFGINLDVGLNSTVPTPADVLNDNTLLDWNTGLGSWFNSTQVSPALSVFTSTAPNHYAYASLPLIAPSTAITNIYTLSGGVASASLDGSTTTLNGDGPPNTGSVTVPIVSPLYLYLSCDFQSASTSGGSVAISQLSLSNPGPFSQPVYQTLLIAVCGGYVWVGQPAPVGTIAKASGQSTALLSSDTAVSMAQVNYTYPGSTDANAINAGIYIVDGMTTSVRVLDISSTGNYVMKTLVPKSSTAPVPGSTFSLCCNWRGRLVLAGDPSQPQNFFMSRAGDPSDWDASQTDPGAAVFGNLSASGKIGEPITALIPYTDDYMLIGCAHSLWMLQGDPADGGTIVKVSDQMGIVGKDAWAVSPDGTLYFVASGGLYSVRPIWQFYQPPQLISGESWNQFFQQMNWSYTRTSLVWDADLHYLHMFFTPTSGAGTHLTLDVRTGGLWPQQFPSLHGPFSACLYLGDNSPTNRSVLLGGQEGFVRAFNGTATDDDGVGIHSYVVLGPYHPFPGAAIMSGCTIDLGEISVGAASSTMQAVATLAAGPDAYEVTEGVAHTSTALGFTLDRRQQTLRQRMRGEWFSLKLENGVDNAGFSFESARMEFKQAGNNRERR